MHTEAMNGRLRRQQA